MIFPEEISSKNIFGLEQDSSKEILETVPDLNEYETKLEKKIRDIAGKPKNQEGNEKKQPAEKLDNKGSTREEKKEPKASDKKKDADGAEEESENQTETEAEIKDSKIPEQEENSEEDNEYGSDRFVEELGAGQEIFDF